MKSREILLFLALLTAHVLSIGVACAEASESNRRPRPVVITDFGTLRGFGVEQLQTCFQDYSPDYTTPSGHRFKMMGAAFVYFGPSNGLSVLGHVAWRLVYCRDDKLFDALYEYNRLSRDQLGPGFEAEYGIRLSDYSDEEKKNWTDSLFSEVHFQVPEHYLLRQVSENRNIEEAWIKADGKTLFQILKANIDRYDAQKKHIQNHENLEAYSLFQNNCTVPIQKDLLIANPDWVIGKNIFNGQPAAIFNRLKAQVDQIFLYPSQTTLREIKLKAEKKLRFFEFLVPASRSLRGTFGKSWILVYDSHSKGVKKVILSPVMGAVNLLAGGLEAVYGILNLPIHWKKGIARTQQGLSDSVSSIGEAFWLELRYPKFTDWTNDEKKFVQDLAEHSALLEYLGLFEKRDGE